MIIKKHLCGIAVAYDLNKRNYGKHERQFESRPQGSRYSQQKRKVADACEYLRLNSEHKPRIFVATTPGFLDNSNESLFIKKLTHNLRNGYNCNHYVWVREFTKKGFPHFHFVADLPQFDAVKLSLYWSQLFGVSATNSIRLGSKPNKYGKRTYWLTNDRHAWYLAKYLGKSIGKEENTPRSFRSFAISQGIRPHIEPIKYESQLAEYANKPLRSFTMTSDSVDHFSDLYQEAMPSTNFNPNTYAWQWTGHNRTYTGIPKQWLKKRKQ